MRIQHNITAMNAYRNYNNNTSAVAKNLEKLSSGYRINRAGDDAAGLAVSEKMRLQISGLEQAQKNAKSGISLVQTAEGALTEVHDMLNRMYTLAEQSANGTFDDTTDRKQLQKEVESLRKEIDRIGKTANFNGIGLFAEYSGGSASTSEEIASLDVAKDATNAAKLGEVTFAYANDITDEDKAALNEKLKEITVSVDAASGNGKWVNSGSNKKITLTGLPEGYTVTFKDASNADKPVATDGKIPVITSGSTAGSLKTDSDLELTIKSSDGTKTLATLKIGRPTDTTSLGAQTKITFAEKKTEEAGGAGGVGRAAGGDDEEAAAAKITFEKNQTNMDTAKLAEINFDNATGLTDGDVKFSTTYSSSKHTLKLQIGDVTFTSAATNNSALTTGATVELTNADHGKITVTLGTIASGGLGSRAVTESTVGTIKVEEAKEETKTADGIWFAIGAEPDTNNQLQLGKMHLGPSLIGLDDKKEAAVQGDISKIDISDQNEAWKALSAIKDATNAVSDMRGTLGAIQNRLDHTINNLSVMQENMQDAESVIRDTDIADEMMAYTKNNILVQSAQAMLAQANQLPQGVLQLLQ